MAGKVPLATAKVSCLLGRRSHVVKDVLQQEAFSGKPTVLLPRLDSEKRFDSGVDWPDQQKQHTREQTAAKSETDRKEMAETGIIKREERERQLQRLAGWRGGGFCHVNADCLQTVASESVIPSKERAADANNELRYVAWVERGP